MKSEQHKNRFKYQVSAVLCGESKVSRIVSNCVQGVSIISLNW